MKKTFLAAVLCLSSVYAAPKIKANHARNAASYASPLAPNSGVAPGSRFVVVGDDLGPADPDPAAAVAVKVEINGAAFDAQVVSASRREVVAVLPASAPAGDGKVILTFAGESAETPIVVKDRAVGLYASGAYGSGAAVATNADDGATITLLAPAHPGHRVRLRATGFGANLDGEIEVRAGSEAAANVIVTRVDDQPGLDTIAFDVPAKADGCFVPVAVRTGGVWTNFVTLAVAPERARCSSPTIAAADLDRIASGERKEIRTGSTTASRMVTSVEGIEMVSDSVSGSFQKVRLEDYTNGSQFQGDFAYGSCFVPNFNDILPADDPNLPQFESHPLNTGELSLSGPKGNVNLGKAHGTFSVALGNGFNIPLPPGIPAPPSSLYLETGTYRFRSTAGDDIGAFDVEFRHNPAIWNNASSITSIDRAANLTLTWTGGGANDIVVITGTSAPDSIGDIHYSRTFVCVARASAGTFTVPSYILSQLPASSAETGVLGVLSVSEPKSFTADGLDTASVSTVRTAMQQASYR